MDNTTDEKGKGGGLAVIIANKMKEGKGGWQSGGDEDKYTEMAQEILDAIKDEDAEKLGGLLKDFVTACTE